VILTVQVPGLPVPQGSIRNLGRGRPSVHANADKLLPWRASVVAHIRQAMNGQAEWPVEGPLEVGLTFYLPRPKSAPRRVQWPATRPDLDKLTRAAFDSLTESGAIRDDAQVVGLRAVKVFGTPGMALTVQAVVPAVAT
jgi:crossover junction endodeoxyribonuclease RusA